MPTVVSYTSVAQITLTLVEIGSMSTLNSSGIAHHASRAETLINAKIANRYAIPIPYTVPLLETLATDLAIYNILTSRVTIKKEDPWFIRYKGTLAMLDEIATGELNLITSSGDILSGRSDVAEIWSSTKDYHPTFWEGPAEDQIQDKDKINDEADDRDITDILV